MTETVSLGCLAREWPERNRFGGAASEPGWCFGTLMCKNWLGSMPECSVPIRNGLAMLRCVICCLLLFIPSASATDASGSMRLASCSFFERYRLKLVGFQTEGSEKALEFNIPSESVLEQEKDWIEVPATVECAQSAQCEIFARGKIQILRVSHGWRGSLKSISGKFVVTFNDGRKIEGNFGAKYVKPSTLWICE
jgi:hypothetical protein